MSLEISEPDWKVFRQIHRIALERYCERALKQVEPVLLRPDGSSHERFLEIARLTRQSQRELASLFDDFRRSTAVLSLLNFHVQGLLAPDDLARLSPPLRQRLESLAQSLAEDPADLSDA